MLVNLQAGIRTPELPNHSPVLPYHFNSTLSSTLPSSLSVLTLYLSLPSQPPFSQFSFPFPTFFSFYFLTYFTLIVSSLLNFENGVLRECLGLRGEWRKLHNEDLNDLYSLPNNVRVVKSRRMTWAVHVASMGEGRGVHRVLVGTPEGKRPLWRPRRSWEDNIKRDLQAVGGGLGD
jgi:hypothetical protein